MNDICAFLVTQGMQHTPLRVIELFMITQAEYRQCGAIVLLQFMSHVDTYRAYRFCVEIEHCKIGISSHPVGI